MTIASVLLIVLLSFIGAADTSLDGDPRSGAQLSTNVLAEETSLDSDDDDDNDGIFDAYDSYER